MPCRISNNKTKDLKIESTIRSYEDTPGTPYLYGIGRQYTSLGLDLFKNHSLGILTEYNPFRQTKGREELRDTSPIHTHNIRLDPTRAAWGSDPLTCDNKPQTLKREGPTLCSHAKELGGPHVAGVGSNDFDVSNQALGRGGVHIRERSVWPTRQWLITRIRSLSVKVSRFFYYYAPLSNLVASQRKITLRSKGNHQIVRVPLKINQPWRTEKNRLVRFSKIIQIFSNAPA